MPSLKLLRIEGWVMEGLIILVVVGGLFGAACATIAEKKNRDSQTWFWLGFVFGLFSLIILLCLPAK
ncbi:hypothetical protein [Planktothrix serta]|nr:hypothetical protein [Planktothrix serta]